jgi:hypothetical protein
MASIRRGDASPRRQLPLSYESQEGASCAVNAVVSYDMVRRRVTGAWQAAIVVQRMRV